MYFKICEINTTKGQLISFSILYNPDKETPYKLFLSNLDQGYDKETWNEASLITRWKIKIYPPDATLPETVKYCLYVGEAISMMSEPAHFTVLATCEEECRSILTANRMQLKCFNSIFYVDNTSDNPKGKRYLCRLIESVVEHRNEQPPLILVTLHLASSAPTAIKVPYKLMILEDKMI